MDKLSDVITTGSHTHEEDVVLPWRVACSLFESQIIHHAIKQGLDVRAVREMLERVQNGEVVEEVKAMLDEVITKNVGKSTVRVGRDMSGPYVTEFSVEIPRNGYARSKPTSDGEGGYPASQEAMRAFHQYEQRLAGMSEEERADMELRANIGAGYLLRRMKKLHDPK